MTNLAAHIMTEQPANPKKFRFLLRSWYNTTRIDTRTQNPNLRRHELKLNIVPRPEPLQSQRQQREKEPFHTISFRSTKPKRRRKNTLTGTFPWAIKKLSSDLGVRKYSCPVFCMVFIYNTASTVCHSPRVQLRVAAYSVVTSFKRACTTFIKLGTLCRTVSQTTSRSTVSYP